MHVKTAKNVLFILKIKGAAVRGEYLRFDLEYHVTRYFIPCIF